MGPRIRELRRALFFSREDLAQRAKISVSFLSMIERSMRLPHVKTLAAISSAVGVPLSQFSRRSMSRREEAGPRCPSSAIWRRSISMRTTSRSCFSSPRASSRNRSEFPRITAQITRGGPFRGEFADQHPRASEFSGHSCSPRRRWASVEVRRRPPRERGLASRVAPCCPFLPRRDFASAATSRDSPSRCRGRSNSVLRCAATREKA